MTKKALFLCSSPKKNSNTNKIAALAVQNFEKQGIETKTIDTSKIKYAANGCIACQCCQKSEEYKCAIKDEASDILATIPDYDFIIFATPVYFMGANAQLKLLLDRFYSLYKIQSRGQDNFTCIKNSKFGLISTAGGDHQHGLNIVDETFRIMSEFTGIAYKSVLIPLIYNYPDVSQDAGIIEKTEKFVNELLEPVWSK